MNCYNTNCPYFYFDGQDHMDCCETDGCKYFMKEKPKSERVEQEQSNVSHPKHYQGEYECIDLMREIYGDEAVRNFCIINAYKYRFRAGKKRGETAQSDLDKADWYEAYVMEHIPKNFEAWRDRMSAAVEKMCVDPTGGELSNE